jgi:hypothetical protein
MRQWRENNSMTWPGMRYVSAAPGFFPDREGPAERDFWNKGRIAVNYWMSTAKLPWRGV